MGLHPIVVQPLQLPADTTEKTGKLSQPFRKLYEAWHRNRISHRSQYSVERLLSFQDYHRKTSLTQVIGVCILTPIPAMLVALLIDCISLVSPLDGWKANCALWIRLFFDAFSVAMGLIVQVKEVIVTGAISNTGAVIIAFSTALCYVLLAILVAATWRFPVPFFAILSVVPMVLLLCSFTVLVIGPRLLASSPVLQKQIQSQLKIIAMQGLLAVVFPLVSAVFYRVSAVQQIAFIFIAPVLKFITKQLIANAATSLHEYVGLVVVFSVDLFNVFYVAICMQTAKSGVTALLMIASDGFFLLTALRTILQQVNTTKPTEENLSLDESHIPPPLNYFRDMPPMIRSVFGDSEISSARSGRIRIFAPFPLELSDESVAFINEITQSKRKIHIYSSSRIQISRRSPLKAASRAHSSGRAKREVDTALSTIPRSIATIDASKHHKVTPFSPASADLVQLTPSAASLSSKTLNAAVVHNATEEIVWDALQTLFHSEYLLMAEYIEFALPVLYAAYLFVLFHLPVATYYPHTASLTPEKLASSVSNILIFAGVEFAAFVGLLLLLRKKFGVLPLYQLGFVLESQARTLQGHLFVWTIFILHMPLTHYGVDFNVPLR